MVVIISEERFQSQSRRLLEQYLFLKEKFPKDEKFKKLGRVPRVLKTLYRKDKVYAVKQLNYLEKHQIFFSEERRSLVVQMTELLQKLILHQKLNRPKGTR
jgi:hypothetical protein